MEPLPGKDVIMFGGFSGGDSKWRCPACHEQLEAVGPASLALAVANHIHDRHERGQFRSQRYEDTGSGFMTTPAYTPPSSAPLVDEAYFDGARLTPYDKTWLRLAGTAWIPPVGWPASGK